jgi:hypothetical protein
LRGLRWAASYFLAARVPILTFNPHMHDNWPKHLYHASGLTTGISATTGNESLRPATGKPRAAMNTPDFKQRPVEDNRQLRMITILAFLLGVPLILSHGIVTTRTLPALGIAPMFFSATMGALILTGRLRSPRIIAPIDLMMVAFLFCFMVPRCVGFIARLNETVMVNDLCVTQFRVPQT